ncbi:hypothetical protein D3874_14800 [Oleomonas cavernae]|uniref:Type II toxin-antitoxin system MqsR family toxin n=1 Tax=Oleomonas cavernae TaxID=2320859 RepID=A0A418WDU9_9PROT|nr:type II toxin-antitoxin system MqsR family toxin [Oleomonas cavernae]RJF88129.1 hypothetical protein D3874_14800 [Oleomonas cavernae]
MAEKRKSTHSLAAFKAAVVAGKVEMTTAAVKGGLDISFDTAAISGVLGKLTAKHFFKSVNTFNDPKRWMDVYHFQNSIELTIYIKFVDENDPATTTEFVLTSFKEK